jgi:transposase
MATLKKGALRKGQIPVFIDESGFYLLPATLRTYAPRGERPELRVFQTHAHLSVIGGITPRGGLFSFLQARSLTGLDSAKFLAHLCQKLGCPLLVIWDRINIHRSQEVKDFLAAMPRGAIQIEELPICAPDLNPQEGIWNLLKDVELRNVCCQDLDHLAYELSLAIRRLRAHPDQILSCFEGAGLRV